MKHTKHTLSTCCSGSVSSPPEQCRAWSCPSLLNKTAKIFFSSHYFLFLDVKQENGLKDHCFCIVLFHYSTLPLINPVLCSSRMFCGLRHSPQHLAAPRALPWEEFSSVLPAPKLVHKVQSWCCLQLLWCNVFRCCKSSNTVCQHTGSLGCKVEQVLDWRCLTSPHTPALSLDLCCLNIFFVSLDLWSLYGVVKHLKFPMVHFKIEKWI